MCICLLYTSQPENKKTKVYLLHADEGQADKLARPDVQVLIGNVKLRHDSMYMYLSLIHIFFVSLYLRLFLIYKKGTINMDDFRKYATKHLGMNGMVSVSYTHLACPFLRE